MQDVSVSTGFDDQDDIDPLFDHVITVAEVRFACRRDMTFRQLFGGYVISYNKLKKASASLKASIGKARRKIEVERVTKNYPTMSFQYEPDDPGMFISGEAVDLAFDVDAVRADGVLLLNAFSHFTPGHEFIGDMNGLMDGHWRAMRFMFAAPHIGFLKHEAYVYNMEPMSLPLYMLLGSKGPDTGKTFMMELLFSAMTGKHDVRFKRGSAKGVADSFIGDMRAVQAIHEGMPYVYDELLSSTIRSVRDLVKDFSAADAKEGTPVLIFTTNDLVDPDSLFRKRVVYIPFDAAIASGVDKNKFKSIGEQMKRGFTGAFYREFTRRYIPAVCDICNMMYDGHPDGWYPDVVAPSSRIILDIFRDAGLQPFSGMRELAWNADYYADSKNAESAVRTISRMWESEPEQFCVQKDTVKIYFGTDSLGQKRAASLANMLPADVMARARSYRDEGAILTFDRAAAEDLGLVFRRGFFSRFRR